MTTGKTIKFLIFLTIALPLSVQSGVYKIVDENGKVSYSQYPPAEKKESTVKQMDIQDEAATRIKSIGRKRFCGDISLPNIDDSSDEGDLLQIREKQEYWRKQLNRSSNIKDVAGRYRYSKVNSGGDYKNQQSRNLRCALNWAKSMKLKIDAAADLSEKKISSMEKNLQKVRQNMERSCGSEPYYDPNISGSKGRLKTWKKCVRSYKRTENELTYQIDKKARQLR